jgi:hypothetical protein
MVSRSSTRDRIEPGPPTPRTSLAAKCSVNAWCKHCSNRTALDLAALIRAGHGDTPLLQSAGKPTCQMPK